MKLVFITQSFSILSKYNYKHKFRQIKLRLMFMHNNDIVNIIVLLIIINYKDDHKSQIQTTEIEGKDNEFLMKNNQT